MDTTLTHHLKVQNQHVTAPSGNCDIVATAAPELQTGPKIAKTSVDCSLGLSDILKPRIAVYALGVHDTVEVPNRRMLPEDHRGSSVRRPLVDTAMGSAHAFLSNSLAKLRAGTT